MHRPNCRCGPWRAAVNFSARLLRIAGWLVCSYALRTPSLHLLGGGGDHDGVVTLGLARGRKLLGALLGGEKGPDLTLAQGRLPRLAVGHVDARLEPVLAADKVSTATPPSRLFKANRMFSVQLASKSSSTIARVLL